jgi:hypothetical protein
MKLKLVKLGNVLVNPQYVIAIHKAREEGYCCVFLVSDGDPSGGVLLVNGTLEQVAERLGADIV